MAATQEEVLAWIKETPLEEMGSVLTHLADKVYGWRLEHGGEVPPQVFEQLLGPVTVSVQLVHPVLDDMDARLLGFALRLREGSEVGDAYAGKYHNMCTTFGWLDTFDTALARNSDEASVFAEEPAFLGITVHHEAPRRNMGLTFMFAQPVFQKEVARMGGKWKIFTPTEIKGMVGLQREEIPIVESNLHQLIWVMGPARPQLGRLNWTFPKTLRR